MTETAPDSTGRGGAWLPSDHIVKRSLALGTDEELARFLERLKAELERRAASAPEVVR